MWIDCDDGGDGGRKIDGGQKTQKYNITALATQKKALSLAYCTFAERISFKIRVFCWPGARLASPLRLEGTRESGHVSTGRE